MAGTTELTAAAGPVPPAAAGRPGRVRAAAVDFVRRELATNLAALVAGAVLWQLAAVLLDAAWLPSFTAVLDRTRELMGDPQFRDALGGSLLDIGVGYGVSVLLGVTAGVAMGLSGTVDAALRYYLNLLLFVPPIVTAPIFLIVFGLSRATLLAIIVVFAATVIAVNSRLAVSRVDPALLDVARVFGAGRRRTLTRVVAPAALPLVFVGLHLGIARAVKGLIIGQLFLAVVGLGAFVARFEQSFDATGIWSIAVVVIAVSLVLSWLVKFVDDLANHWAREG